MKKFLVSLFILNVLFLSVSAQKKQLTLRDAIYMNRNIYPASVPQLQWIGHSDDYAFAKENALYKVSAKRGTELKRLPQMNLFSDKVAAFNQAVRTMNTTLNHTNCSG